MRTICIACSVWEYLQLFIALSSKYCILFGLTLVDDVEHSVSFVDNVQ